MFFYFMCLPWHFYVYTLLGLVLWVPSPAGTTFYLSEKKREFILFHTINDWTKLYFVGIIWKILLSVSICAFILKKTFYSYWLINSILYFCTSFYQNWRLKNENREYHSQFSVLNSQLITSGRQRTNNDWQFAFS